MESKQSDESVPQKLKIKKDGDKIFFLESNQRRNKIADEIEDEKTDNAIKKENSPRR